MSKSKLGLNNNELPTNHSNIDTKEFIKLQFEQAIETFRTQISLLIQMATLLAIANITVIGYAISEQISGVLLVGPFFPLTIIYIIKGMQKLMLPIVYVAISLESKYYEENTDWLATTFVKYVIPKNSIHSIEKLKEVSTIENTTDRIKKLRSFNLTLGISTGLTIWGLVLIAAGQAIASILLTWFFNWRLF